MSDQTKSSNVIRVSMVQFNQVPPYDVFSLNGALYRKRKGLEARLNNNPVAKAVKIDPTTMVRWVHALTEHEIAEEVRLEQEFLTDEPL